MSLNDEIATLLYQAAASPIGIVVVTPNPRLFQARAGTLKNKLGDPLLANLTFRRSPREEEFENEIWIVQSHVDPEKAFQNKADMDRLIEEITLEVTGDDTKST